MDLLVGGLVVSVLLFGVIWSMATTRDRAYTLARSMTLALRRANEELDSRVRQRTEDLSTTNEQLREEAAERQRVEIDRAAALERERARVTQLRALADAGLGIGEQPDDDARLEYLADRACQIVGCRHAFLVRETGHAERLVSSTLPMSFGDRRSLLEASAHWPTRERIEVVRATSPDPGVPTDAWPEGCSEAMIVPVRVGTSARAATLYLLHGEGEHFRLEDEVFIHHLVLLVTAAMATAAAVERERRARLEAESANISKDDFLAIVSHELRTPLHAILGWLQVLERKGDSAGHLQRAIDVIRRNAEAQGTLIDDLLDLARIEQGKLGFELQRLRFDEMVREIVESHRHTASARALVLDARIEARGDVYADPVRLQQAVGNLVSNALKFSAPAGRVGLRLYADGADLVLEVEDDGEGIDAEVLPRVFERFIQGDASSRRRKAGLGLGLALVKHIVEAHGGSVSAASVGKGHGAVFTMRLPLLDANEEVPPRLQRVVGIGPAADGKRKTVLLIETDDDSREAIPQWLDCDSLEVFACGSMKGALQWLQACDEAHWPDAILCDIDGPGRGGDEFYDEVRALEQRRGHAEATAMAALTSSADADLRIRALAHGFVAHLTKPLSPQRLQRLLERVLGLGEGEIESGARDRASDADSVSTPTDSASTVSRHDA